MRCATRPVSSQTVRALTFTLPLALGGEAAGGISDTAIGVLSAASILGGYLLLAALWYFVFRDRKRDTELAPSESRPDAAIDADEHSEPRSH